MKLFSLLLLASTLPACASIVEGSTQSLSVVTTPVSGAECKLKNDAGTWFIPQTPGSVSIKRSGSDMTVICTKGNGLTGNATVASKAKGLAYGNILAGGIIGGAVDMGTGAAYDYPYEITVPLKATDVSLSAKTPLNV